MPLKRCDEMFETREFSSPVCNVNNYWQGINASIHWFCTPTHNFMHTWRKVNLVVPTFCCNTKIHRNKKQYQGIQHILCAQKWCIIKDSALLYAKKERIIFKLKFSDHFNLRWKEAYHRWLTNHNHVDLDKKRVQGIFCRKWLFKQPSSRVIETTVDFDFLGYQKISKDDRLHTLCGQC